MKDQDQSPSGHPPWSGNGAGRHGDRGRDRPQILRWRVRSLRARAPSKRQSRKFPLPVEREVGQKTCGIILALLTEGNKFVVNFALFANRKSWLNFD